MLATYYSVNGNEHIYLAGFWGSITEKMLIIHVKCVHGPTVSKTGGAKHSWHAGYFQVVLKVGTMVALPYCGYCMDFVYYGFSLRLQIYCVVLLTYGDSLKTNETPRIWTRPRISLGNRGLAADRNSKNPHTSGSEQEKLDGTLGRNGRSTVTAWTTICDVT